MLSSKRFTPEFKEKAVRQVVERGYGVPDVAARLGGLGISPLQVGQGGDARSFRATIEGVAGGQE